MFSRSIILKGYETNSHNETHADILQDEEHCLRLIEKKIPRFFHIFCFVVVPTFVLIALTFMCGYGLAKLESPTEQANNDAIASKWNYRQQRYISKISLQSCFDKFEEQNRSSISGLTNYTDVKDFLNECVSSQENEPASEEFTTGMTFDWIKCEDQAKTSTVYNVSRTDLNYIQTTAVHLNWNESFTLLKDKYLEEGMSEDDAIDKARDNASGTKDICEVNTVSGALFWFTVMSTIGYGHAAPVTVSGRLLVGIMGFFSIMCFAIVVSEASIITITIFDDMFERIRFKRLKKRLTSLIFWILMIGVSFSVAMVFTFLYRRLYKNVWRNSRRLSGVLWWMFISITTVGLGDTSIQHETFTVDGIIFFILLMLINFVFINNLVQECSDYCLACINNESLRNILAKRRDRSIPASSPVVQCLDVDVQNVNLRIKNYELETCKEVPQDNIQVVRNFFMLRKKP